VPRDPPVAVTQTQRALRLVQEAVESLRQLAARKPSAADVASAMGMVTAYVLPHPGLRQPQLEDMLRSILAAAEGTVDMVGIACTLAIVLKTVGDVADAQGVVEEERIQSAYLDVEERIQLAHALSLSLGTPMGPMACPRCDFREPYEGDGDPEPEDVATDTEPCICAELKVKRDMDRVRTSLKLAAWWGS
jgi:hypothetical protein